MPNVPGHKLSYVLFLSHRIAYIPSQSVSFCRLFIEINSLELKLNQIKSLTLCCQRYILTAFGNYWFLLQIWNEFWLNNL